MERMLLGDGDAKQQTGQVTSDAAEVYEALFLPALFAEWAPRVVDEAEVKPGDRVLDVGCGTGVVAREAERRVMPGGWVSGLDLNPGMLAVARRKAPRIDWREGRAESLPFPDAQFDAVTCQFSLMFFEDPVQALREMARVARPSARIVVTVWDVLERTPGEAALTELLERHGASAAAEALRAPYSLGSARDVRRLFESAEMPNVKLETVTGTARYDSVEAYVETSVKGWTFADMIDDEQYRALIEGAEARLARHVDHDGRLVMPAPAHVAVAQRPA